MQEIVCGVCGRTSFVEDSAPPSCPSCGAPLPAEPAAPATTTESVATPETDIPVAEAAPADETSTAVADAPAAPETEAPVATSVAVAEEPAPRIQHAASVAVAEAPVTSTKAEVVAETAHDETGAKTDTKAGTDNGVAWFVTGIVFLLLAILVTGWILWLQYIPL